MAVANDTVGWSCPSAWCSRRTRARRMRQAASSTRGSMVFALPTIASMPTGLLGPHGRIGPGVPASAVTRTMTTTMTPTTSRRRRSATVRE
eukprot:4131831-Prymnesium_polylepis.1